MAGVLPIQEDVEIRILTARDEDALMLLRHSAAHVLATAVRELIPTAGIGFGPAIEDGFYYDFEVPELVLYRPPCRRDGSGSRPTGTGAGDGGRVRAEGERGAGVYGVYKPRQTPTSPRSDTRHPRRKTMKSQQLAGIRRLPPPPNVLDPPARLAHVPTVATGPRRVLGVPSMGQAVNTYLTHTLTVTAVTASVCSLRMSGSLIGARWVGVGCRFSARRPGDLPALAFSAREREQSF